jgi:sulfate transport system ATP-binding protein
VHEGVLAAGDATLSVPDHSHARDALGVGYVRPHELDIEPFTPDGDGIVAVLKRSHAIGPLAQLELERSDGGGQIEAVLPAERFAQLQLHTGAIVRVKPRRVRVFLEEAA